MARSNNQFDTLITLATAVGFVAIPAIQGPDEITRLIKPAAVVDVAIVVAQNNATALDDAEDMARELTVSAGGHYEVHTHGGDYNRVAYPVIITYLSKA